MPVTNRDLKASGGTTSITDVDAVLYDAAGNALNHVDEILRYNKKGIYRDNDEIVIFNQGEASFFDIVNMNYETGLVKLAEYKENEEKKRSKTGSDARDKTLQVDFTTLLLPRS